MKSLFILTVLAIMVGVLWRFIKETIVHRKRMKKLDRLSKFHKQLMDWSEEISDINIRDEFMNFCVLSIPTRYTRDFNIDDEKMNIYLRWGSHIPSLLQEFREKKLNSIL